MSFRHRDHNRLHWSALWISFSLLEERRSIMRFQAAGSFVGTGLVIGPGCSTVRVVEVLADAALT